jgi:hypothetical protein
MMGSEEAHLQSLQEQRVVARLSPQMQRKAQPKKLQEEEDGLKGIGAMSAQAVTAGNGSRRNK